jgi:hypothetical protein
MKAHLEGCETCERYANGLTILRDTWRAEHARHDRESERRLAGSPLRARATNRNRTLLLAFATALTVALFVRFVARTPIRASEDVEAQGAMPEAPVTLVAPLPPMVADPRIEHATPPSSARASEASASAIAPLRHAPEEEVPHETPPAAGRPALAWSVTLDTGTVATTHGEDPIPWLDLHEGTARAETSRPAEIRTSHATTHADDGAWQITAGAAVTHVEVTRGNVTLIALHGFRQRATLRTAGSADVRSDGRITVVSAQISSAATPGGERASFALAEQELARGERVRGRGRLLTLIGASDLAIAGDAAFLLARSAERPSERSAVLGRYLARRPPSPYEEQAMVEQAHAFLDAGDRATASAIATDLAARGSLPDVVRPSLARLDVRIKAPIPQRALESPGDHPCMR